jgi:hypothetical protein
LGHFLSAHTTYKPFICLGCDARYLRFAELLLHHSVCGKVSKSADTIVDWLFKVMQPVDFDSTWREIQLQVAARRAETAQTDYTFTNQSLCPSADELSGSSQRYDSDNDSEAGENYGYPEIQDCESEDSDIDGQPEMRDRQIQGQDSPVVSDNDSPNSSSRDNELEETIRQSEESELLENSKAKRGGYRDSKLFSFVNDTED